VLVSTPFQLLAVGCYSGVLYGLAGLRPTGARFGVFFLMVLLLFLIASQVLMPSGSDWHTVQLSNCACSLCCPAARPQVLCSLLKPLPLLLLLLLLLLPMCRCCTC
jgi:hypothetical protein